MEKSIQPLSVAIISSWLPPIVGGIPVVISSLVKEFLERKIKITILSIFPKPNNPLYNSTNWIQSNYYMQAKQMRSDYLCGNLHSLTSLVNELRGISVNISRELSIYQPDLIHSHTDIAYPAMIAESLKIPIIHTLHHHLEEGTNNEQRYYLFKLMKETKHDAVNAVSHYVKKEWENMEIFPKDFISVIYNPVEVDAFYHQGSSFRKEIRKKHNISSNIKLLCYPQRLEKPGVDVLLKAFVNILNTTKASKEDFLLLLCGNGSLPASLGKLIHENNVNSSILIKSFTHEQMPEIYAAADIVILPSAEESFGLPAIEAVASGTPIISSESGAYKELLFECKNNTFFTPNDVSDLTNKIFTVINNTSLPSHQFSIDKEKLRKFSPEVIAQEYISTYFKLLCV